MKWFNHVISEPDLNAMSLQRVRDSVFLPQILRWNYMFYCIWVIIQLNSVYYKFLDLLNWQNIGNTFIMSQGLLK